MAEQNEQIVKRKTRKGGMRILIILLITHLLVGFGGWKIGSDAKKVQVAGLVSELSAKEISTYTKKVSALMVLPKTEVPKVVVLNNVAEIAKQQPFFTGAKNGDIFLVYNDSKKAIIYRPDENIIVNVGPVYGEPAKQTVTEQNSAATATQDNTSSNTNTSTNTDQKKTTGTTTKTIKN